MISLQSRSVTQIFILQGTAIKDRIQEQLRGLEYEDEDEDDDSDSDNSDESSEEESDGSEGDDNDVEKHL